MTSNELRIGNLVYVPSGIKKFVCGTTYKNIFYTSNLQNSTYGQAYDYECNPIPLTEEWLLDLGFTTIEITEETEETEAVIFDFKFSFINKTGTEVWFLSYNGELFKELKYVHELQNLYFALTGKELEIEKL